MTEVQPSRQPLSHVNSFPVLGTANKTPVFASASASPERMYTIIYELFSGLITMLILDPGDWHLHALLAQLTACIESKPAEKPPTYYGITFISFNAVCVLRIDVIR